MQRVTIDYRAIDPGALQRAARAAWPRRVIMLALTWVIMLAVLAPIVAWQLWEGRWLSLALLASLILVVAGYVNRNSLTAGLAGLRRLPPITLTIQPDGLEVYAPHHVHLLQGWTMFQQLLEQPRAFWLMYRDHGSTNGYLIPRPCFADAEAAEDFLRAARAALDPAASRLSGADSSLVAAPAAARYALNYQLTRAELFQDDALKERLALYPETLSADQEQTGPPRRSWPLIAGIVLWVVLLQFEEEWLTLNNREFSYALPAFGVMLVMPFVLGRLPKLLAWIRQRRSSPAPHVEVLLADEGIFRRSDQSRLAIPWSGVDTLQVHAGRLLLWRGSWCRLIIPLRAFATPAAALECERWIRAILNKQFNRLAVAELAEPEPVIALPERPASDNPYQAPLG